MSDATSELSGILEEYGEKVKRISSEQVKEVAKEGAKKLKETSPKKTGDYAKGWTFKKTNEGYVLYNKNAPGLTHLLENGHVVRNAKGTFGRAPAYPHIAPVREWAEEELVKRLESKL